MTPADDRELADLAAGAIDDVDDRALALVASLYATVDPVPAGLVDRISFGITLDALHTELAELERSPGLVGVRADETTADTVTFTSESLTAMVTMSQTSAETVRVDGWITPAGARSVELRTPSGTVHAEADTDGRFAFASVRRGLVQFTFGAGESGQPVMTPAMEI